jgi:hypothetical protein
MAQQIHPHSWQSLNSQYNKSLSTWQALTRQNTPHSPNALGKLIAASAWHSTFTHVPVIQHR